MELICKIPPNFLTGAYRWSEIQLHVNYYHCVFIRLSAVISVDNMVDRLSDVKLQPTKDKVVKANEVLAAGHQPRPIMETIIVTLLYLALHSEKIELELELVAAVLDNLSKKLQYNSRYIGELIASIIFFWVQCGVSLAALVEHVNFFVLNVEASNFIQCCYCWLLPALVLHNDVSNLNWVAKHLLRGAEDKAYDEE
ncbi:hypothetical protein Lser_V15G14174 [Lactuca serriola]